MLLTEMLLIAAMPLVQASQTRGISAATLGVIVNLNDPQSVAVANYYQRRRGIPAANVIRVRFRADADTLEESEFRVMEAAVNQQTSASIQAYALTWMKPYRVDCMSITTAIAMGFSRDFCSDGCKPTRVSHYYDSDTNLPMVDFALRPTMMLAAVDVARARKLIDRGVASDGTAPKGTAYLVNTGDAARNVRSPRYALAQAVMGDAISIKRIDGASLSNATDVMFYFTGAVQVPDINTNHYLPGAVADHLTSTGGGLLDTDQMSSLRWLEAGATGSYGTVVEPCNFTAKFPDPVVMMKHYLTGETLIEAYWKSVAMPGSGLFIGEPLARPYGPGRSMSSNH
jgi:uncharacterized protein (TIGR03790 family)